MVLNAAKYSPTIIPLLEQHTLRHYAYLRDTMPSFVPELNLTESTTPAIVRPLSVPESLQFLKTVVANLDMAEKTFR